MQLEELDHRAEHPGVPARESFRRGTVREVRGVCFGLDLRVLLTDHIAGLVIQQRGEEISALAPEARDPGQTADGSFSLRECAARAGVELAGERQSASAFAPERTRGLELQRSGGRYVGDARLERECAGGFCGRASPGTGLSRAG